jgi:hypothetical protein
MKSSRLFTLLTFWTLLALLLVGCHGENKQAPIASYRARVLMLMRKSRSSSDCSEGPTMVARPVISTQAIGRSLGMISRTSCPLRMITRLTFSTIPKSRALGVCCSAHQEPDWWSAQIVITRTARYPALVISTPPTRTSSRHSVKSDCSRLSVASSSMSHSLFPVLKRLPSFRALVGFIPMWIPCTRPMSSLMPMATRSVSMRYLSPIATSHSSELFSPSQ